MNTLWSNKIQSILNLESSRELRFRDDRKELFLNLLGVKEGMAVVDVGCGPGVITRKLSKRLGENSKIIGIDRDSNFIEHAKKVAEEIGLNNVSYYEGDALSLPIEDDSVDACISYTVIEHVSNREFLLEQKRITKPGGRISVMYARPDKYIKTEPNELPKQSERERKLLDKLFPDVNDQNEKYGVGMYWPDPIGLPKLFEEVGLINIQIDAIAVPVAIDDYRNSFNEKIAIVEAEEQQMLESVEMAQKQNNNRLTDMELDELQQLINNRFDKRIGFIKNGVNIWDYIITMIQIVSGTVK